MPKPGLATIAAIVDCNTRDGGRLGFRVVLINRSAGMIKTVEIGCRRARISTGSLKSAIDPQTKKEDATVKPGARMTVHFNKGEGCKYDVKLNFADNSNGVWSGINVCDNSYVTVKYTAGATAFTELIARPRGDRMAGDR